MSAPAKALLLRFSVPGAADAVRRQNCLLPNRESSEIRRVSDDCDNHNQEDHAVIIAHMPFYTTIRLDARQSDPAVWQFLVWLHSRDSHVSMFIRDVDR